MKVLHLIDSMGLGGAQTIVKGIFENQKDSKNIFLFPLRIKKVNQFVDHPNVIKCSSISKYSLKPLFIIKNIIRDKNIDVLHCHLFKSQVFGYIVKLIWFPNVKLTFHEHGEILQSHKIYDFFMKVSKQKQDTVIAVSNATKNELLMKTNQEENKIQILKNFIDFKALEGIRMSFDKDSQKEALNIQLSQKVISFVGRLESVKGCRYLIEALPFIKHDYKLLVVGEGSESSHLIETVKKLKIQDKVIFLGYQSNPTPIYLISDLLIVPSLTESFGLSVIEAQALKVPVIASNIPGLDEVIQNNVNGMLFKMGSVSDISEKINYALSHHEFLCSVKENGLLTSQKYSVQDYINKLNSIYAF